MDPAISDKTANALLKASDRTNRPCNILIDLDADVDRAGYGS